MVTPQQIREQIADLNQQEKEAQRLLALAQNDKFRGQIKRLIDRIADDRRTLVASLEIATDQGLIQLRWSDLLRNKQSSR